MMQALLDALDRLLGTLALPVTLLLLAQWPLRDAVGAWSTQANDLAQCLFALFVAGALHRAGRSGQHLVARAERAEAATQGWRGAVAATGLLAWSAFVLVSAAPATWSSLRALERFPESFNPGYFIIRLALVLLAALLALQAAVDLQRLWRTQRTQRTQRIRTAPPD